MKAILDIDCSLEDRGEVWGICQTPKSATFTDCAPTLRELKEKMIQTAWNEHNEVITDFEVTDITFGV